MEAKQESTTRAFRLPKALDDEVVQKAKDLGYMTPSEYLRSVVRRELEKEA
jgi:hypothetical protein